MRARAAGVLQRPGARRLAIWLLCLVPMLGLTLPLRWVVAPPQLARLHVSAQEISGSIWSGTLRGAHLRGQPLGDVGIALAPLSLLTGVARLRVSAGGSAADEAMASGSDGDIDIDAGADTEFSGDLLRGRVAGVEGASGRMSLSNLATLPGLSLRIRLDEATLTFADGRCRSAGGRVAVELAWPRTPATPAATAAADAAPLVLTGEVACQERSGVVRMAGASDAGAGAGAVRLTALVEIEADGRYRVQSLATTGDDRARLLLQAAGFQDSSGGLSRVDGGALLDDAR